MFSVPFSVIVFFSDASAPLLVPQPLFFLTSAAPAPLPKPQPLFPLPHFARSTYDSAACATLHHSSFSISHSRSAIFEIFLNEIKHAARVLSRYRDARRTRILRIRLRLTVRVKKGSSPGLLRPGKEPFLYSITQSRYSPNAFFCIF